MRTKCQARRAIDGLLSAAIPLCVGVAVVFLIHSLGQAAAITAHHGLAQPPTGQRDSLLLVDPAGDIEYHPAHPSNDPHPFIDILSWRWQYHNRSDTIGLTLETVDNTELADPPSGWIITCRLAMSGYVGDRRTGELTVLLRKNANSNEFGSSISFTDEESGNGQGIEHAWTLGTERPGKTFFEFDRWALLRLTDSLAGPSGHCQSTSSPTQGVSAYANLDQGEGDGSIALSMLGPAGQHPVEESFNGEEESSADNQTRQGPVPSPSTSSIASPAALIAFGLSALARRWRRAFATPAELNRRE